MKLISIEKKLPDIEKEVLLRGGDKNEGYKFFIGRLINITTITTIDGECTTLTFEDSNTRNEIYTDITHWGELPTN